MSHITQPVDGRRKHMARSIGLQGTETPQRGSPCHPRRIPAGLGVSLSPCSLSIQSVGFPRTFLTGVLREPQAKPGPRDHVWGSSSALAGLNRVRRTAPDVSTINQRAAGQLPRQDRGRWGWGKSVRPPLLQPFSHTLRQCPNQGLPAGVSAASR